MLQNLQISIKAAHTAQVDESVVARRGCTKKTRVQVLEKIQQWLCNQGAPVFWLTGGAGIGKTTIAKTVCEEIAQGMNNRGSWAQGLKGRPLVSFFLLSPVG